MERLLASEPEPGSTVDELATSFAEPPSSAAPHTYWMWMNGNVTRQGITLDLETMKRVGIAGAYIYQCAVGIPRGPVDYGSAAWLDLIHHAISEAGRLGLSMAIHNAPGYSGTGGPWITPEMSMQELVWTETLVDAHGPVDVPLPRPRVREGYYRDAYVLAYPSLAVETATMRDRVARALCNGRPFATSILWSGDRANKVRIEKQPDGRMGTLDLEFDTAFEARAITVYRSPEAPLDPFDGPRDYPPTLTLQVSDDGVHFRDACTIAMPALRSMNSPGVQSFSAISGRFYRLLASRETWITGIDLQQGPRLHGWAGKANGAALSPTTPEIELVAELCIDPTTVLDLSRYLGSDGRLRWVAPKDAPGRWTIVRLGHTSTGEVVAAAPDSGVGLECDKLRTDAVDLHFTRSLEPLFARLGPLVGKSLTAILSDSWEAGKQNWTPLLPEYFKHSRGYDLWPWALAMTGRIVGSVTRSNQFLFDLRRTHAQMLAENYYGHFQRRCHEFGLQFHAEPYGDGTFDSLQVAEHLDLPMGEFWARYTYGSKTYMDLVASASHTLGKPLAAAESFTGAPLTSRWTGHPYSMKAEGDRMFTFGVNRFVFHTFVHQPHPTAKPGMTMGPFGTHFDRNNTWMSAGTDWMRYLARAQSILQSGEPVADVCLMKGEEPTSGVPDPRTGRLAVPEGIAVDIVSPAVVMRASVERGLVSFCPGMAYRCMILSPLSQITPPLLRQLAQLVEKGMTLIASVKPVGSPALEGQPQADAEVAQLVHALWADLDGKTRRQRGYGKGQVFLVDSVEEPFRILGLEQDFEYAAESQGADIVCGHRRIGGDDVYFVSNQRRRAEEVVCSFRVVDGRPELWDPERGGRTGATRYESAHGRTQVQLTLPPAGSIFVVFRKTRATEPSLAPMQLGQPPATAPTMQASLADDFCCSAWVQPETYVLPGTSFVAFAEQGSELYGEGHAAIGIAAGQNGVWLYERSSGAAHIVLQTEKVLSGWVHLAVIYRERRPTLYLNGVEAAVGQPSRDTVHAPRDVKSSGPVPRYFEGNMLAFEIGGVPSSDDLRGIVLRGVPAPPLPRGLTLERSLDGRVAAVAWTPGTYRLSEGARTRTLAATNLPAAETLSGPWELTFPDHLGAPSSVMLPALIGLNQHEDFGVRHFSGTLIYRKSFHVDRASLAPSSAVSVDLGRVDVTATVTINGRRVGEVWKPPYRLEVTPYLKPGENELVVTVTTLWPNRLIGDEQLPVENEYDVHGPVLRLPGWYTRGEPKPGQRVAFCCWHPYRAGDPLLQSGLSGPVTLCFAHSM